MSHVDSVKVGGVFDIVNGPGECKVAGCDCGMMHIQYHNKLPGGALRHIANACFLNTGTGQGFGMETVTNLIRVGTGSGATTDTTVALVSEVGTAASSGSIATSTPTAGTYRITIINVWNANVLSAVAVTEIGVKSRLALTLGSQSASSLALFSRLSTTDTEFTGFTVNPAVPLQITYRFDVVFA